MSLEIINVHDLIEQIKILQPYKLHFIHEFNYFYRLLSQKYFPFIFLSTYDIQLSLGIALCTMFIFSTCIFMR